MSDEAPQQRYFVPAIDVEVERVATDYLRAGGGFLSRARGEMKELGSLSVIRRDRPPPEAEDLAELPPPEEPAGAVAPETVAEQPAPVDGVPIDGVPVTDGAASGQAVAAETLPAPLGIAPMPAEGAAAEQAQPVMAQPVPAMEQAPAEGQLPVGAPPIPVGAPPMPALGVPSLPPPGPMAALPAPPSGAFVAAPENASGTLGSGGDGSAPAKPGFFRRIFGRSRSDAAASPEARSGQ